jgi:predicted AlkP superfamily pyrophosphatase or phosphodiesterase
MKPSLSVPARALRTVTAAGATLLTAASLVGGIAAPRPLVAQEKPSLVVLLTVDQFRADYLQRYGNQLTGGLGRLARHGATFNNAHQDHAITETAPGHATLLSGRHPRSTEIMMNSVGVDDETAPLLAQGYGPGASPARFRGTTLVDWMQAADKRTRTLSVSMKDRGAILPVGRSKADVYWYSIDGRFLTSTYYRKDLPPWVRSFNERRLAAAHAGKSWELLLPDSAYAEKDSVPIEMGGRRFMFPHRITDDEIDAGSEIRITPFIDDLVLAFALHGVTSLQLGAGAHTDLLAVSLSATDVIGHNFGPDSREMHDQVLRVDQAVGRFLDSLYTMRDSSRITVVFTSDHGVGTIPELAPDSVQPPPRRVSLAPIVPAVRAKLRELRADTFAISTDVNVVVVDRRAFRRPQDLETAVNFFVEQARTVPGVARVDRFKALLADTARDPLARRWANQFPAASNVEAVITLAPLSTWGGNIASHGSPHDYDSHVPLVFSGFGVRPGVRTQFVRTVDIAPTLAKLLGVKVGEVIDGVPLPIAEHPDTP